MPVMEPITTLLLFALPLILGLGGLLAHGHAGVASARQHALVAMLAVALAAGMVALFAGFGGDDITAAQITRGAFAITVAQLIAAPLLDRSRLLGLILATLLGTYAVFYTLVNGLPNFLPPLPHAGWLLAALLCAALIGLVGSAALPMHPARQPVDGLPRMQPFSAWRLIGLILLALGVVILAWAMEPETLPRAMLLSSVTAALAGVLLAPPPYRIARAAEGMLAGLLIALMAQGDAQGIAAGLAAAVAVARGGAVASSLQLDDPAHVVGAVLCPTLLGLLWPGLMDWTQLAPYLHWVGCTLALGIAIGLVVWPLAKLSFGLEASARSIREGLDS